jgi:hypothetical protein
VCIKRRPVYDMGVCLPSPYMFNSKGIAVTFAVVVLIRFQFYLVVS